MKNPLLAPAVLAALVVLSAAVPPARAEEGGSTRISPIDLEEKFYRAFYAETGLRDFEKAAEQYAEVHLAARAVERKDLAVKALLGRARCLRTLGKPDEAKAAYAGALELEPENEEAARGAAAGAEGTDADAALASRIEALVDNLAQSSASARELRLLGDRCLPALEAALYATDLSTVESAAVYLASLESPAAGQILVKAMRDPKAIYRSAIARAVLRPTDGGSQAFQVKSFSVSEVPVLAAAAESADADLRRGIVRRLLHDGDGLGDAGMSLLLRLATDPEKSVRMAVLEHGLDRLDVGPVLALDSALRRSLRSEDSRERLAAAKLAGKFAAVQAQIDPALRPLLGDPDADVRAQAFAALRGRFTEGDLVAMLDPADSVLTAGAIDTLRGMSPWSPGAAAKVREGIERAIRGEFESVAAQKFVEIVEQGFVQDRSTMIDLFALTGSPDAKAHRANIGKIRQGILNRLGQNVNWQQSPQKEQMVALIEEGVEKCLPWGEALRRWVEHWGTTGIQAPRAWIRAAASEHEAARKAAYFALLKPANPPLPVVPADALPHLARDLVAGDGEMRSCALQLVNRSSSTSPALAEPLRKLHDAAERPEDRTNLLYALVKSAGRDAETAVRADLARPETRDFALRMLVNELGFRDRKELDAFVQAGGDPSVVVCLNDLPNPPGRELLRGFVNDIPAEKYTPGFLPIAARCVDGTERTGVVRAGLRSDVPGVRALAAQLVGDLRMLELWPDLLALLEHGDARVRQSAEKSLAALKTYAELKSSFASFGKDDQASALRDAEALLKSGEPLKRKGAVLALAALGDRSAVPALLKALDDEHLIVREAALAALERLGGKPAEPK